MQRSKYQDHMGYEPIYQGDLTWRDYWDCTFTLGGCDKFPKVSWLRVSVRTATTKGATAKVIEASAEKWYAEDGWIKQVQKVRDFL
jgi:hypothetical protein